jgi:2-desacetyl-2-hydroxyethyl bacteriochlorophyllide A dehydrogenase
MKAWQYIGDNLPITLNEIDEPVAGRGDVVIDVKGSGICHSDIGMLDGTISHFLAFTPITLGHEIAGIVQEVGENVTDFKVGDRVAACATIYSPGTGRNGGFQPRVAVQAEVLVKVPDGVPWDQAAVSTDAGTTSYHAVISRAQAKAGNRIGIIGYGGLGSLGAHAARHAGAEVYVAETNVALHQKILDAGNEGVSVSIRDFKELGLDAIVDFAGFGTTTADAVQTVKPGGTIVQVGLAERYGTLDLVTLSMSEIVLMGSTGGTNQDNSNVLQLMAEGVLKSDTECIGFEDIGAAIGRLRRGENKGRLAVLYGD